MPYRSISELPTSVKTALPVAAQHVFMSAFNSAYEGNCKKDDACSSQVAWSAVKNVFHKDRKGIWVKNIATMEDDNVQGKEGKEGKEEVKNFVSSGPRVKEHEAVLHMLDRSLPSDNPDEPGIFYAAEPFSQSLDVWKGCPVVFGQVHPDLDEFAADPVAACNKVGANVVGSCTEAWIDQHGHTKLMGSLKMLNPSTVKDENVRKAILLAEKLFNEGKLSPSTAFSATSLDNKIMGHINPNHILLFEESETGTMPRDLGAGLLNATRPCKLQVKNMPNAPAAPETGQPAGGIAPGVIDRFKTLLQEMMDIISGKETETPEETLETATANQRPGPETPAIKADGDEMVDTELKNKVDKLTADFELLKTENATLKQENEALKKDLETRNKAEADAKWANIKPTIETGLIDTPEKETAFRAGIEKDPLGYMANMMNTKLKNAGGKEGAGQTPSGADPLTEKYLAGKKLANTRMRKGPLHKTEVKQ